MDGGTVAETATDRLRLVVGDEGLERLERARVAVIGLGGVGSSCAEALARGGVEPLMERWTFGAPAAQADD